MDKHEFISSAFSFELANNPTKAQDYLEQLLKEQKIMHQINYSRDETILNTVNKINQNPEQGRNYQDFADLISKVSPKQAELFRNLAKTLIK